MIPEGILEVKSTAFNPRYINSKTGYSNLLQQEHLLPKESNYCDMHCHYNDVYCQIVEITEIRS